MIKNSLKIFLKNLIYLFVSMGIVYFFFLVAIFTFIASFAGNIAHTLTSLADLISISAQSSATSVEEFLSYAIGQINWNASFEETIRQIIDSGWLQETVKGFFATLNASTEGFETQFIAIINTFKNKIIADIAVAGVLIVIGIVIANFATRYAIRHRSAKRDFKKFFVAHTLVPIFQSCIIVLFFVLLATIKFYSFPAIFVMLILSAILSLAGAWLIYKDDKLKFSQVLTAKNILKYIAVVLIVLLINIVVAVVLLFVNVLFALLLIVPFAIYSFNIVDINTEAYVVSLTDKKTLSA